MKVPFFTPNITDTEINAVVECLKSGWLTTGPATRAFEEEFAAFIGVKHAVALNSCTAALHLALEALGLQRGELVLVPTMTFAATAEVVRYFDAIPVFVDCERKTQCIDVAAARDAIRAIRDGASYPGVPAGARTIRAIIPMHYGGQIADMEAVHALATEFGMAVIEDAAHTLPAFARESNGGWRMVGTTSAVSCFSFYANKCITTGEGGMAVTNDDRLAERMRLMALHGMSKDAWKRYTSAGSWYYEVVAPGFKYNLTDIAATIGRVQLARANQLWEQRRSLAERYLARLAHVPGLELPIELETRRHSWHLFSIRLELDSWLKGRNDFIDGLRERGVATSVHWLPLHMQPYYRDTYHLQPNDFPVAASLWPRLVTLPLFAGMTDEQLDTVVSSIADYREQSLS